MSTETTPNVPATVQPVNYREITKPDKWKQLPADAKHQTVKGLLQQYQKSIEKALPRHISIERLMKVALTAITKQPELLDCDPNTFMLALMGAGQLGLEPNTPLGSAYLVPFFNSKRGVKEIQLIPGYRGLIELARRSGEIASIEARVVYENDSFEFSFGLEPKLVHTPTLSERGSMRLVYAVARLKGEGNQPIVEVMTKTDIDKIKAKSKAGNSGPWVDHYDEMARKTVVRRLCKYLPLSIELATAIDLDNAAAMGDKQTIAVDLPDDMRIEVDDEDATGTEKLAEKLAAKNGKGKTDLLDNTENKE